MLGRVARRRQEQQQRTSREKTLEPDRPYVNPVTRSATTVLNGDRAIHAYQKERTPYKVTRQRHKYGGGGEPTPSNDKPHDANPRRSRAAALTTSSAAIAADYDPIRRKDTLYDAYAPRSDRVQYRYGDHSTRSKALTKDLSYLNGADKENHFKSKYDPAGLYADHSSNTAHHEADDHFDTSDRERERKRALRSYKRTCTANDRRHTTNYKDVLNQLDDDERPTAPLPSRYSQRQSTGYQRSQTQQFFDAEIEAAASVADHSPVVSEREARRKEIQGLIMKYAQLDDVYNKATEDRANNNNRAPAAHVSTNGSGLLSTMQPAPSHLGSLVRGAPEMLALSKTQSVSAMSSIRSRIPKALTTFVRLTLVSLHPNSARECVWFSFFFFC